MKASSKVVLLGTGTPNADPHRSGPALAVVVGQDAYLVDFGPGVVRQAAAAYRQGISALAMPRLRRAFLTHLHSDHTAGYPDLILTPWVLGREHPLEVYGPKGLIEMTDHIQAAYAEDIRVRLEGPEPANSSGYRVEATEVEPGFMYADANLRVEAFETRHGAWQTFGYKFHTPDQVIVISGDTAPCQDLLQPYQDCDLLVHEVSSWEGLQRRSPAWKTYHASMHTSTRTLAKLACQAKPGLLILYHQLFHGVTEASLLAEVKAYYPGRVVSGHDLGVYPKEANLETNPI